MSHNGNGRHCFSFAEFRLYPEERLLVRDDVRVALTPRVLDLLIVLVNHHGELVSKETLLTSVWSDSFVEEGNINRTVSTLRKSLGAQANGSDFIETVPKLGYRFVARVQEGVEESPIQEDRDSSLGFRRPVFWIGAIAGALTLMLLASSYAPSPLSTATDDRRVNLTNLSEPEPESSEPFRLTHGPGNYSYPVWTNDGRIRYQYHGKNKNGESYVMDSNGSGQTLVEDIPDLRQGYWSPDGKRVYFWKRDDPSTYLADSDGGNEKKLPFNPGNTAWSPDSTRIVFQSVISRGETKDWEISVFDLATGKIINITNDPAFDADPSFSPDGKQIIFTSNRDDNIEIYLVNVDGTNLRRLTNHPAWDSHPVFSPDGTQIIFNSNRENENYDVYLMNVTGSDVTKVTNWESHEEIGPGCWSEDGTRIVFISNNSGDDNIYVMNVEPFHPRLVLADENASASSAVYSPDSKQIVYQAELPDRSGELRVHDIATSERRVLLKTTNGNLRPVWSADGKRIAFQNKIGGETTLFAVERDGSGLTKLTDNPTSSTVPAWSPTGSRVVFVADSYGQTRLRTTNPDTGEQFDLTAAPGWETDPVWSPDGIKIAFSCDRLDAPGNGLDICVIDTNGGGEKRVLLRGGHDTQPSWSPDGSRLAFVSTSDGNPEIYVMNSDGTGLLRLTRNPADDILPHWVPDGRSLIFTSNRSGKLAIYEVPV